MHINLTKNKISKNVSVMYRVKHLMNSSALYSLYCSLIMPYFNYCCEIWDNILIRAEYILCILFRKELLEYVNKLTICVTLNKFSIN